MSKGQKVFTSLSKKCPSRFVQALVQCGNVLSTVGRPFDESGFQLRPVGLEIGAPDKVEIGTVSNEEADFPVVPSNHLAKEIPDS